MRKSRTEPSFSSFSTAHSSDFADGDSSGFEDDDSNSEDFEENNFAPIEFPGIALPNDLQAFLHSTTVGVGKNLTWKPVLRRKETFSQIHQGKSLKRSLAAQVVSSFLPHSLQFSEYYKFISESLKNPDLRDKK